MQQSDSKNNLRWKKPQFPLSKKRKVGIVSQYET